MSEPQKRELAVVALSASESQVGSYVLVLEDVESNRLIPLIIGVGEAQAIAIAIEQMQPVRPLTHDLLQHLLDRAGIQLRQVFIHTLEEGVFHASLHLVHPDGNEFTLDARPSDAIALALRTRTMITMAEDIVERAGIASEIFMTQPRMGSLASYTVAELEALLEKVLAKEDYESAVRIRNFIEQRRKPE
ncbi:MAG: bifunctional nuclease family protein [Lewinellaceae bacterium]|nr:bifunctional nuclease family protein [Lewinellaceae bacterium]